MNTVPIPELPEPDTSDSALCSENFNIGVLNGAELGVVQAESRLECFKIC